MIGLSSELIDALAEEVEVLLLFPRVLRKLFFHGLTGEAGGANSVELVAKYANDFGCHCMIQDCDAFFNAALIVFRDGAFSQVLSPLRRISFISVINVVHA